MNFGMITLKQSMEIEQNCVSFVIHIKTEYFFEDISVERWLDTSTYDENDKRPLPIGKNKNVPGLFKDELGGKIIVRLLGSEQKHTHT